jgi:hypothetical protein
MEFRQIDPEQKKQVGNLDPVDGTQAVQLVDSRNGIGILDLGEPGMRYVEFRASALVLSIAVLAGLYVSMAGKKFNNTYLGIDDCVTLRTYLHTNRDAA